MIWLAIAVAFQSVQAEESGVLVQDWLGSVVKLTTGPSLCAGVMLEEPGLVATAYHCVATGRRSKVETRGGEVRVGRLVATDPEHDLAIVRVEPFDAWRGRQLRAEAPELGERIWALGHPFGFNADMVPALEGLLYYSVSSGIVSAIGPALVQVDAPLNPGNSGGPILDAEGRVVGIASRKLRGEGLSFIAPAPRVRELEAEVGSFRPIGGQYALVAGLVQPGDIRGIASAQIGMRLALRDTLVLSGLGGMPLGANWEALSRGEVSWMAWEASAALRGRAARGRWSTALDAGVVALGVNTREAVFDEQGLRRLPDSLEVKLGGTLDVGFGGATYGVRVLPGADGDLEVYVVVSVGLGGVMGTF